MPSRITAAYQGHFRLGAYLSRARLQIVHRIIARFLIKQAGLNAPKVDGVYRTTEDVLVFHTYMPRPLQRMIFKVPPQWGHCSMSISNTRLSP